jgi:small subunit ribosomal protein S8
MTHDLISDLLARIRNAGSAGAPHVNAPASKLNRHVLDVLIREGYVEGYETANVRPNVDTLRIKLKYYAGRHVIEKAQRVSKPGCRRYTSVKLLSPVRNGLGISILSTSRGILSDREARDQNLGGEVLCSVY